MMLKRQFVSTQHMRMVESMLGEANACETANSIDSKSGMTGVRRGTTICVDSARGWRIAS